MSVSVCVPMCPCVCVSVCVKKKTFCACSSAALCCMTCMQCAYGCLLVLHLTLLFITTLILFVQKELHRHPHPHTLKMSSVHYAHEHGLQCLLCFSFIPLPDSTYACFVFTLDLVLLCCCLTQRVLFVIIHLALLASSFAQVPD